MIREKTKASESRLVSICPGADIIPEVEKTAALYNMMRIISGLAAGGNKGKKEQYGKI
ncbi:MAG: hypothetical protein HFG47_13405 [Lachnospiraceae bacterium]|nr:hypothetical protein [Lachnospiraceae bacterium]